MNTLPAWLQEIAPIAALLAFVALFTSRLPKIDVGHSDAFVARRRANWLPAGLTYAFLYMARYNLNACKNALGDAMSKEDFGTIFFWGTLTYGVAFVINGPLTDRFGGRRALLTSALGAAAMNVAMGLTLASGVRSGLVPIFSALYAANMYFQSFGAVAIVKVNSAWFHVRERGTFGGVFGILISLGVYFAYDWGRIIAENLPVAWVFLLPAAILLVFAVWDAMVVRDHPSEAGLTNFDPEDATVEGEGGAVLGIVAVGRRMLQSPIILIIAAVEFCSGYLRNAIMQWYPIFAKETGAAKDFVPSHWGLLLCLAGIVGGMLAGVLSDRVFGARRGPVSAILYGGMVLGCLILFATLTSPALGWVMVAMSLCIIGVHGMLSGTASMDFGGRKNAGVAVGIIDGLVYLGTAAQAWVLGHVLPAHEAQRAPANWRGWPVAILPVAVVGLLLAARLWNARPPRARAPVPEVKARAATAEAA